jgi:hypothetical protein
MASPGTAQAGYLLSGSENLQQFVNQQVEIRGTVQTPAATTPEAGAPSATAATNPNATGQPTMPTLRITSVRLLGGACPGGR